MTNYPFKINGEDFSDVVHKYGYETERVPVFSRTVTTLDGVDHSVQIRTRGKLTITINPLKENRAAEFFAALKALPVVVGYRCLQTGEDLSETMVTTGAPLALAMKNGGVNWLDKTKVTFEQQ